MRTHNARVYRCIYDPRDKLQSDTASVFRTARALTDRTKKIDRGVTRNIITRCRSLKIVLGLLCYVFFNLGSSNPSTTVARERIYYYRVVRRGFTI